MSVFTNCNVCGIKLRTKEEDAMGMCERCADATPIRDERDGEIARLKAWVNDLQSGMYINCVYCGHRYGPEDEIDNMQDALTAHVGECPKHPLSRAKATLLRMFQWQAEINELMPDGLGDEIRAILGDEVVDVALGLKKRKGR